MHPADPPQPAAPDLAPLEGAVTVLVDADACPVKEEIYRVAERHGAPPHNVHLRVVANRMFRVPVSARVKQVLVSDALRFAQRTARATARRPLGRCQAGRMPSARRLRAKQNTAADDWIAAHAGPRSLVVTGDILLADRALKAGATVLAHTGKPFDTASIGSAIATRAIMADLRAGMDGVLGGSGGGPAPFREEDRSRFLQALDQELVRKRSEQFSAEFTF